MSQNILDASGIQIQTYPDIVTELNTDFQTSYGPDVNLDANSSDGQLVNILALSKKDMLDLNVQTYSSFDLDQAVGTALDRAAQYTGIFRKGGVYTQVVIQVVASAIVTIQGQDSASPFTISDINGNIFQLVTTTALSIGTNNLTFQAVNIGFIQILANTLTVQVTPTLGVTSVNNSAVPVLNGSDQESDAAFRVRIQRSNGLLGTAAYARMLKALLQISGLTNALVYINHTNATDVHNVPGHSVYVIVDGGTDADVAAAIYANLDAGCGMVGSVAVPVTQIDATQFTVLFDRVIAQNLYVKFAAVSKSGASVDQAALSAYLAKNYILTISELADITRLSALVYQYSSDLYITGAKVSLDNTNWFDDILPTSIVNKFVLLAANVTFV